MRKPIFLLAAVLFASAPAMAKSKKPKQEQVKKPEVQQLPPPGDKRGNDGANGRKNATEDAARAAEGQNQNRIP